MGHKMKGKRKKGRNTKNTSEDKNAKEDEKDDNSSDSNDRETLLPPETTLKVACTAVVLAGLLHEALGARRHRAELVAALEHVLDAVGNDAPRLGQLRVHLFQQ